MERVQPNTILLPPINVTRRYFVTLIQQKSSQKFTGTSKKDQINGYNKKTKYGSIHSFIDDSLQSLDR